MRLCFVVTTLSFLLLFVVAHEVTAWAPASHRSLSPNRHRVNHILRPSPSWDTIPSIEQRRNSGEAFHSPLFSTNPKYNNTEKKNNSNHGIKLHPPKHAEEAQKMFRMFLKSLGKGVFFAIPMTPSVSNALFGIKSKRKNDKRGKQSNTNLERTVSFSLREGLTAIAIYLGIGVLSFSYLMEHWSFIDALYFSVVSFTTVGYGDLVSHTYAGRIFTCLFSLGGIAFLAAALASIGSNLAEAELKTIRVAQKVSRKRVFRLFERTHLLRKKMDAAGSKLTVVLEDVPTTTTTAAAATSHSSVTATDGSTANTTTTTTTTAIVPFNLTATLTGEAALPPPPKRSAWAMVQSVLTKLLPPVLFLTLGGVTMGKIEGRGWSLCDSVYYAIITAATVGFGDVSPVTQRGRLAAVVFIPVAVAAGGEILGTIASAYLEHRRSLVFENLVNRDLTMDHIKEMDNDGDGVVSQLEYLEFMLVEMKLVEKSLLKELRDQFGRLDVNMSGCLSKEDLVLMAKLRRSKMDHNSQTSLLRTDDEAGGDEGSKVSSEEDEYENKKHTSLTSISVTAEDSLTVNKESIVNPFS